MDKSIIVTFTEEEVSYFEKLGDFAYYIDNNFYNIPSVEENKPDEFLYFKRIYEEFFDLFVKFHNAGKYKFKHRRTIEMDNLYTKLIKNLNLLESHTTFCDNIENWSVIVGNNKEIDYIIDKYIDNYIFED